MFKLSNLFSFLTDFLIRSFFGLIFFNFGYGKLEKLINGESENLIKMVESIFLFGLFPVFFSWCLALSETFLFVGFIYGLFVFFPYSIIISRLSGLIALVISLVIVYQHIYVWGDNVFFNGPIQFLNTNENKKFIYPQLLFVPISMYIIFNNRTNMDKIIDNK
mgnify:CR=1 FL=1|tara:strand:- start:17 stop:505 length:489 start_codon:yes stop_codon:yes gene_type:complete